MTNAVRANGRADVTTLRVGYERNSTDVDAAVASVTQYVSSQGELRDVLIVAG